MKQQYRRGLRRICMVVTVSLAVSGFARAGLLEETMRQTPAYRKLSQIAHTPAFRVESFPPAPHAEGTQWWWIYDGPQKIGLIQTWTQEIEMFRFTRTADGKVVEYSIPPVHHWATLVGPKLSIAAPLWEEQKSFRITFIEKHGPTLAFSTETELQDGAIGASVFRLGWDPTLGYVWDCKTHCRMATPQAVEFNNMLAPNISDSREHRRRWQKVLRGVAPGNLTWFYVNPLNVPKGELAPNGFVGFVREPDMNPFVALQSVNAPVRLATCSQWYDQHIIADAPAEPEADGLYHVRARYRFLSIPADVAAALEANAQSINRAPDDGRGPGFLAGVTNDFERAIPGDRVYSGAIWRQPFTWDREQGHSGTSSLRITGKGSNTRVFTAPIGGGTAVYGESAKRYRLTVWVRSDLEDGEAYVQVDDCFWNWTDMRATRRTEAISGKTDWTQLAVEFQPVADDPFLLIKLVVEGTGQVWFDDLALLEVKKEAP